jgi:hypothetical protein
VTFFDVIFKILVPLAVLSSAWRGDWGVAAGIYAGSGALCALSCMHPEIRRQLGRWAYPRMLVAWPLLFWSERGAHWVIGEKGE